MGQPSYWYRPTSVECNNVIWLVPARRDGYHPLCCGLFNYFLSFNNIVIL